MPKGTKTTPAEYHQIAREHGFEWLGPWVKNNQTKTRWRCSNGHTWWSTYAILYQGKGCRQCYEDSMRLTPDDYHRLARENGFEWLGPEVDNNIKKTKWKCSNGHIFESTYAIIQSGNGCIQCRNDALRKWPEDYHKLAAERGYQWLGPEVDRTGKKTKWQCPCGNKWWATYNNILRGRSCPKCRNVINGAQVSQNQIELCKMLDGELNHSVAGRKVDILVIREGVRVATEYDSWYWHGNQQDRDTERDDLIIMAGYRILRVKSNTLLPTPEQLEVAISRLISGSFYEEIVLSDWGIGPFGTDVLHNCKKGQNQQ